jgi:hypothetical protein
VEVLVDESSIRINLDTWQKVLGLMRDIAVPLAEVRDVRVLEDPLPAAMGSGLKVGLRLPWLYYVARTIRLDEAFIVRRGVAALSFGIEGEGPLRRVLVSTPRASELAQRLGPLATAGAS